MPGVSAGTISMDWRLCGLLAFGSVSSMMMKKAANFALEENHFSPLITHSSPSSTARVSIFSGSAPPCGSVMAKQETISLFSSGFR